MRCRFRFAFVGLFVLYALSGLAVLAGAQSITAPSADAPPPPQIQQIGPHNAIVVRAAGLPGHYSGFDVLADDRLVAPVRFTSHDLIACAKPVAVDNGLTSTLVFNDLQADPEAGIKLQHSRVVVTLRSQQYPTVAFDLHIVGFDAHRWQDALGLQPFHFLTLGMPDATVWHQEGWLFAAPRADLFPLLLDVHQNAPTLAAAYNQEWSRTPPLSAHPLPVIGLWSPAHKLYAAWDFQAARLEDHSERDIATGFCNRLVVSLDPDAIQTQETVPPSEPVLDWDAPRSRNGQPPGKRDPRTRKALSYGQQTSREFDQRGVSKFVALVYPSGGAGRSAGGQQAAPQNGGMSRNISALADERPILHAHNYQQLVYPAPDTRLASHAALVFSADLSDTDDPNRFLWQNWWNTPAIQSRLSRVPRVADLGGIPGAPHAVSLPAAPQGSLLARAAGDYVMPGSLLLSGQGWRSESGVDAPAQQKDKARLASLQADAQILLKYVRRFWDSKEPCAYWEQPLAGEYTPYWGGEPAVTLHNAEGWAAGRLLLDLYHMQQVAEAEKKDKRKESADSDLSLLVPRSSFMPLIDGVFNWTKHSVWTRGSVMDRPAAPTARDGALAVAFLLDYYFTFKADLTDGARRTRALQALDLARTYAYRYLILWTGDNAAPDNPRAAFEWQAIGGSGSTDASMLNDAAASLDALAQVAAHTGDPILLWALQGSMARKPEGRAAPALPVMLDPVGTANARALCGEQAALAFDRNAQDIVVTDYHCTGVGDFAFTLRRLGTLGLRKGKDAPMRLVITFPYADLSHKVVAIRRGSILQRTLTPGVDVMREPNALWSLVVDGLHNGDTVLVGSPDLNAAETLPSAPPLTGKNQLWIKAANSNETPPGFMRP